MARLLVTNDPSANRWAIQNERAVSGVEPQVARLQRVFVCTRGKERHPVPNLRSEDDGNLAASSGSMAFQGLQIEDALGEALRLFDGGAASIQANARGNYVVFLYKEGRARLFSDDGDGANAYYWSEGALWVAGNSLAMVAGAASASRGRLAVDEVTLVEQAFIGATIGTSTLFKGIRRLRATESLLVDPASGTACIEESDAEVFQPSAGSRRMEAVAEEFTTIWRREVRTATTAFSGDVGVCATGGIDNRLLLAGLLSVGARPKLIHGIGYGSVTGSQPADEALVRQLGDSLGLEVVVEECRGEAQEIPEHLAEWVARHGELSGAGSTKAFYQALETGRFGETRLLLSGLYLDRIRMGGSLDLSRASQRRFGYGAFSMNDYVDFHLAGFRRDLSRGFRGRQEEMRAHVEGRLEEEVRYRQIPRHHGLFEPDAFPYLYEAWIRAAHAPWERFANEFTGCVSIANQSALRRIGLSMPMKWRQGNRFALRVIEMSNPRLLGVPVFSHGRRLVLQRGGARLRRPIREAVVEKCATLLRGVAGERFVRGAIDNMHIGAQLLGNSVPNEATSRRADALRAVSREMVRSEQKQSGLELIDVDEYAGEPRKLLRYAHLLAMIRLTSPG